MSSDTSVVALFLWVEMRSFLTWNVFTIVKVHRVDGGTSLVAQTVKHPPTMQETWVQSPGREDFLEKEMAIHASILAWKIP